MDPILTPPTVHREGFRTRESPINMFEFVVNRNESRLPSEGKIECGPCASDRPDLVPSEVPLCTFRTGRQANVSRSMIRITIRARFDTLGMFL